MIATIRADPQPIVVSIGMPATCRLAIATTTVMPAKSTERPAVALARPTASAIGMPEARFCRWRARMKSA